MEITRPTFKDKKLSRSDNTLSQFITSEVHEAHGVTLKNLFANHLLYPDMFLSRLVWIERDLYDQAQHEVALDTSPFVDMSRLSDRTRHELSDELSEAAAGHDYLMHHTKSRSFPVKDDLSVKFIYEPDEYEGYSRVTMSLSDDENKYGSTAFHIRGNPKLRELLQYSFRAVQPMFDDEDVIAKAWTKDQKDQVKKRERLLSRFMRTVNGGEFLRDQKRLVSPPEAALVLAEAYLYSAGVRKVQGISTEYFDASSDAIGKFDADSLFGDWMERRSNEGVEYPWENDFSHGIYFPNFTRLSPQLRILLGKIVGTY